MADQLNQSLDEILSTRRSGRPARGPRGSRGRRAVGRTTRTTVKNVAPANGINKKGASNAKAAAKQTNPPTGPSGAKGQSKIIVSNLPADVTENQIKEYFGKNIGPVKQVTLTYGPNGVSRGICTIAFVNSESSAQAAKDLNGVLVDKRPMKIEVVIGAEQAPAPKSLSERIAKAKPAAAASKSQSKAQAKQGNGTNDKTTGGKKGPARGRNSNRRKAKTTEELDAEMADYFGDDAPAPGVNGGAAEASGAGDAMEDEIMVNFQIRIDTDSGLIIDSNPLSIILTTHCLRNSTNP
ncbi:MAG: hypothetical protein Q9165_006192 [Trypethelium subeluteriae]